MTHWEAITRPDSLGGALDQYHLRVELACPFLGGDQKAVIGFFIIRREKFPALTGVQ